MRYRLNRLSTIKAKCLRKKLTDVELFLWKYLRAYQLDGLKFRRQEPIGPYIVDFICFEKRVIIEVDGSQHAENKEYDAERSAYLMNLGFIVLRFWNNEVLNDVNSVLEKIRDTCNPHPSPLPEGEGIIFNQRISSSMKGFSLTELILYLAIIGILVGAVTGMFVSFSKTRAKAEAQTELAQNARSAMERLRQEIVKACSVASVSSSSSQATIKLNMPVSGSCGSTTITAFQIVSSVTGNCTPANTLLMKESAASGDCADVSWSAITGSKVSIAPVADTFTQITNTGAKSTIQIKLTLTYQNKAEYTYATQTTVGLR